MRGAVEKPQRPGQSNDRLKADKILQQLFLELVTQGLLVKGQGWASFLLKILDGGLPQAKSRGIQRRQEMEPSGGGGSEGQDEVKWRYSGHQGHGKSKGAVSGASPVEQLYTPD